MTSGRVRRAVGTGLVPVLAALASLAVPASPCLASEPTDELAARRRQELVKLPMGRPFEMRILRDGEILVRFDAGVPEGRRDAIVAALLSSSAALFERDGWARPFSSRSPLEVRVVLGTGAQPAVCGWDGREGGRLLDPVIALDAGPLDDPAREARVCSEVVKQLALLTARQAAPQEATWAVEGLALFLERTLGLYPPSGRGEDPFLEEVGSLTWPQATAGFLSFLLPRLPEGMQSVRRNWEDVGERRGDDAEAFLREIAAQADPRGLSGLLGDLITARLGADASKAATRDGELAEGVSRAVRDRRLVPDVLTQAPGPLGWRRISFRTNEERGGLEILLPQSLGVAAGKVLALYRSDGGALRASLSPEAAKGLTDQDAIELVPGQARIVPISSISRLHLILVDGPEPGDLFLRLRRVPDYPASLVYSSAEWSDDAVQLVWRTASHRDLLAWIVVRLQETDDGSLVALGSELIPTSDASDGGFTYHLSDREARLGQRHRYRVYGLTTDGFLTEAFEASVVPGR